jgi:hypothetical protein
MAQLCPTWRRLTDVDIHLPDDVYEALLEAYQVSDTQLPIGNRGVGFNSLPQFSRVDYCPLCFLADLSKRRTPFFRFQWTIPYQACCHVHKTPLMPWRKVRYADERVLPLKWALQPRARVASACEWLDEDAQFASRFGPERVRPCDPLTLVNRLAGDLVVPGGPARVWTENHYPFFGFRVHAITGIGATSRGGASEPLASLLRPSQMDDRLFGPPKGPYAWSADERHTRLVWGASTTGVAFRRSLLWFAARTVYESDRPTQLANGQRAPRGDWERWWEVCVKANARQALRTRICAEADLMRRGAGWRAAQHDLQRCAALERLLT